LALWKRSMQSNISALALVTCLVGLAAWHSVFSRKKKLSMAALSSTCQDRSTSTVGVTPNATFSRIELPKCSLQFPTEILELRRARAFTKLFKAVAKPGSIFRASSNCSIASGMWPV